MKIAIYLTFLILNIAFTQEKEEDRTFSFRVIILQDYDFIHQTQIEKKVEKPWVIYLYSPYCQECMEFVPVYEELVLKAKKMNYYFAAVDCYKNEDVRDRIVVPQLPSLIVFDTENLVHRYDGPLVMENLEKYVLEEEWKNSRGKRLASEINYWKRFLRKLSSFKAIVIYLLILIVTLSVYLLQRKNHNQLLEKMNRIEIAQRNILDKKKQYLKID